MNLLDLQVLADHEKLMTGVEHELKLLVKIKPGVDLNQKASMPTDASLCLLFDCSASMLEDGKLDAAIDAAKMIAASVSENQKFSLIAFQSRIHILLDNETITDANRAELLGQIESIRDLAGGSTNMADALTEAARACERGKKPVNVVILLTDGVADFPDTASATACALAEADVQLFAVGIGTNYKADHLLQLVTNSNGVVFAANESEKIKETLMGVVGRIENFVVANVRLEIKFSNAVEVGLAYKAAPEQAFLGSLKLDAQRTAKFNVGNVEAEKEYAFLVLVELESALIGTQTICETSVIYDVPLMNLTEQVEKKLFTVDLVSDRALVKISNPEVSEVYRRVTITQLTSYFTTAYDKFKHGKGTIEDVTKYLRVLVKRCAELRDDKMKARYEMILDELIASGMTSMDAVNRAVVESTVVAARPTFMKPSLQVEKKEN